MVLLYLFTYLTLLSIPSADTNITYFTNFGNFKDASSISIARNEFIYVTDAGNNVIYKYDSDGKELIRYGGSGFGNDQFNQPLFIDASNGLNLFITDHLNNRIQVYDLDLNYIRSISLNTNNLATNISGKIDQPLGSAFLSSGEMFILADAGSYRIVKSDESGNVTALFGGDVGNDRVLQPVKILVGNRQNIFVFDSKQDIVLEFDNSGSLVRKIKNMNTDPILNIAYFDKNLYILYLNKIYVYDIKAGAFTQSISYNHNDIKDPKDIAVMNKNTVFILSPGSVFKIEFK